jgi:hypothetical protein
LVQLIIYFFAWDCKSSNSASEIFSLKKPH